MAEWKYDLGVTGKQLREAINTDVESIEACVETLRRLLRCSDWINKHCSDDVRDYFFFFRMDVEENIDYISGLDEDDYDVAEMTVNDLLGTFYDYCDCCRIWVGL